jgi:hypothetical protein
MDIDQQAPFTVVYSQGSAVDTRQKQFNDKQLALSWCNGLSNLTYCIIQNNEGRTIHKQ